MTILCFGPQVDAFELVSAFLLLILITPTFLLVQDVLGKKDDELANQKRIIFSEKFNKLFFYSSLTLMVLILSLNNLESLLCYVLLFSSTLGYAAAKHYRKMVLSYSGRYLSSVFTVSLYIFILVDTVPNHLYFFVFFISVLDLVGNIAGDLRDVEKDRKAGVKTLVTVYNLNIALQIMSVIVIGLFSLLIFQFQSPVIVVLFLFTMGQFVLVDIVPLKFSHGVFHLGKLLNFISLTALLTNISIIMFFSLIILIIFSWSLAYYFYLYNSGLSSHA